MMNTQASVRVVIFSSWLLFWGATSLILLFAPHFRSAIGMEQIMPAIGSVASVWLPVLSCFAGYWFTNEERHNAAQRTLSRERTFGAVGLSVAYLIFVITLIVWVTYGVDYSSPEHRSVQDTLPTGISFKEQLDEAIKMSLWISPLATAPVLALTGRATRGNSGPTRRQSPDHKKI